MTTAARLLRQARRARGLSQRQLASSAREHQSSIADFERGKHDPGVDRLDELVGRLGYGLTVLPTRRRTVADAADAIYQWLRSREPDRAYRELIQLNDDLASEKGALRVALAVTPPPLVGDRRFDAFIAALVEYRLRPERLPVPEWTSDASRRLEEPWTVDDFAGPEVKAVTPKPFRDRRIFLDPAELTSA
jgi:transcriptional regulator with XRE-family HTH domain